jgi:cobalt-zinc-cadmium efflux system outer membrane protein
VGQADKPDLLAADIEAQRIEVALATARNARERTWRQLGAAVGDPGLRPAPLEGDLEKIPKLDLEEALAAIYRDSPELRAAQAITERSDLAVRRARAERIPDVVVRGGLRYNRELLDQLPGNGGLRPVGIEGFFDIGVEIPIFNRNQGGVAAARAESERARFSVERTRLSLRLRLAEAYREYQDALVLVERYRTAILPQAEEAYRLYLSSFRQMAAAYPQALIAQRNLFQLQEDYVTALASAWQRTIEIQGLLLTAGVEGPRGGAAARAAMPDPE